MDVNPYQAPRASERDEAPAGTASKPSRAGRVVGVCCFCVAFSLLALGLSAPDEVRRLAVFWIVVGSPAGAFVLMGLGIFVGRQWWVLGGFCLFLIPIGAAIVVSLARLAGL